MNRRISAVRAAGLVALTSAAVATAIGLAGTASADPYGPPGPPGYNPPGYNQGLGPGFVPQGYQSIPGPIGGFPGGPGPGPVVGFPGGQCGGPCGPPMGTITAWNVGPNGNGVMVVNQFGVATFAWCPPPPGIVRPCFDPMNGAFDRWETL